LAAHEWADSDLPQKREWHPMKRSIDLQDLSRIAEKLTPCMERISASVAYTSEAAV
jgi:hypothetical protein